MEPAITVGTGLVVLGSKEILSKLLGPTADYIGEEILNLVKRCNINLDNVFAAAVRKLGNKIDEPGVVNPRILKHIIDEGLFCEDAVVAEYLGGVLATSRTLEGRDDRGISFLSEIKALSSYQIRIHYLIHSAIIRHGIEEGKFPLNYYEKDHGITLLIDDDSFERSMEYSPEEHHVQIARQSLLGLEAKGLCQGGSDGYAPSTRESQGPSVPFRCLWPTPYGNELFAWGLGLGHLPLRSFFDIKKFQLPLASNGISLLELRVGKISYRGDVLL